MPLDTRDHQCVQHDTKKARNTAARARRGTLPGKAANGETVLLICGPGTDEAFYIITVSPQKEPSKGYLLTFDGEHWRCSRFVAKWRDACSHTDAAREAWKLGRLPAVQEALQAKRAKQPR
ncbi:MAG TPA: hypothetical protein VGW38_05055 [Chloroflexota bacterium]|nr:hypothetical protein [Chloroflexota bacterium]